MAYTIIIIYLVAIFVIAFLSKRVEIQEVGHEQDIIEGQYLASRSLTFWESLGSIIATEVSALTFLGIPAFAYAKDFSFVQIYIGAILGRWVIAKYFLPQVYAKGLTVYSIITNVKGNPGTLAAQKITTLIYMISKILAVGVRLYSGSILVAQFFHLHIFTAITLILFLTLIYTSIGGLKAVVRTDLLQALIFIAGGLFAHYYIPQIVNTGWGHLWTIANTHGKTAVWDINHPYSLFIGIFGGILFDMATHGVDQDFTQRIMATKTIKTGQRAIFYSSFFSIAVGLLFLSIGALLFACNTIKAWPPEITPDHLFAYVITTYFPAPMQGFMLAGVVAATMSTLDSTINALSSCLWNDIFTKRKLLNLRRHMHQDGLLISVLLLFIALLSSKSNGLLELGLKVASWSGGALVAFFMARLLWNKCLRVHYSAALVLSGYGANLIAVYINTYIIAGAWQWNVYIGATATLAVFALFSRPRPIACN